jgi:hypothetical protein
MTNNEANTSLGSKQFNEPVDRDELWSERGDVNVQIGEDSYIGDIRVGVDTHIRAIDLWD